MNERTKIRNERGKAYNDLHIQDTQFIHDGHDSKVNERCYEVEREY